MLRGMTWIGVALAIVLLGCIVLNFAHNPMAARRSVLESRLAEIPTASSTAASESVTESNQSKKALLEKPGLWRPLVAPPPAAVAAPDLDSLLAGVLVTRQEIGNKVKMFTPQAPAPRGVFLGVGETVVKDISIKTITPTTVVMATTQNGKEYTKEMPRQ